MISVIIPTYGTPLFLSKSIESVLNQTFHDLELIIVDDNNPDTIERAETEAIVREFVGKDGRIRYIKHPRNLNGATARNTGIQASKGEYISFLDSDDEYMPERLEKCYTAIRKTDALVAGVYTGCEFRRAGKKYYVGEEVHSGNFLVKTLACTFGFYTGSNLFVKRNVVEELNGFDTRFLRHQDYEFLVRVFEKYSLIAVHEVLVVKNNENFNLPNVEKMIDIKKQYIEKFQSRISALPEKERDYVLFSHSISIAEAALQAGKRSVAKDYYAKARSHGKLSFRQKARKWAFLLYGYIK